MTKYLKLDNYIEENINSEYLQSKNLEPFDTNDSQRQDFWRKKISGSKVKDVISRPLTTMAYLLGFISEEEWKGVLNFIPRMNYYRDHGKFAEDHIINMFNTAILNEGKDDDDLLKVKDTLIDFASLSRMRDNFFPAMNEKYFIKSDKRTFFRTGKKYSNLFMLNIDGYTENDDKSIRQIVEVKTKTGALGNNVDFAGYMKLHLDQMTYYAKMAGTTHGVVMIVDHWTRGMKVHTFSQREIDNHWNEIKDKIKAVGLVVAGSRGKESIQTIVETIENVNWGEESDELISKEKLIKAIKLTYNIEEEIE